jgi:hypothetical protein
MSKRKKRAHGDGIYKITFRRGTPYEAVMTAAIGLFLKEIGLSMDHLLGLGYSQGEIQVEVLRILLRDVEEAYGMTAEPETP